MKHFIYVKVIIFCLIFYIDISFANDNNLNNNDNVKILWEKIQKISVSMPDNDKFDEKNVSTTYRRTRYYWTTLQTECMNQFWVSFLNAVKDNQIEKFARDYVAYFGMNGNDADLRWCLACPIMATNNFILIKEGDPRKSTLGVVDANQTSYWELTPEFKRFACEFNKTMIERSLSSKEIYQRMYCFMMWSADYPFNLENKHEHIDSVQHLIGLMEEGLNMDPSDPKFWFAIRWGLLLAYLCRQESIFDSIDKPLTADGILQKIKPLGENIRMLSSVSMIYSSTELRYVPIASDSRLPPFKLPQNPFPNIQNNTKLAKQHYQHIVPKNVDPITREMFNDVNMFNSKFLEKICIKKAIK
ncbi:MAG: hypothetical protein LBP59_05090 [Planctomycetaceae bacterium]|jgi:hypothetical protein|nr:hypothetical protein [Planctomycetaceae bacterium]